MNGSDAAAAQRPCADVSVIVPAWRAGATIQRALASISAQTLLPAEVVVVDDGSDDDTVARAEAMADALNPAELRVFRQAANLGPGAARNRAIAESRYPVLAFLDADDEWLPDKLEKSLGVLGASDVSLVAHDIVVNDGAGERVFNCARHLPPGTDPFVALFKRGFVATASVVCRRADLERAGGFDETLRSGQDYELWLAMARQGSGFALSPEVLTRYHVMPGSVSSNVELRRRAAIAIAVRHAPALRGRARFPAAVLALRLAIVSMEAVQAHLRRGAWGRAVTASLAFPVRAASALCNFSFGRPAG